MILCTQLDALERENAALRAQRTTSPRRLDDLTVRLDAPDPASPNRRPWHGEASEDHQESEEGILPHSRVLP